MLPKLRLPNEFLAFAPMNLVGILGLMMLAEKYATSFWPYLSYVIVIICSLLIINECYQQGAVKALPKTSSEPDGIRIEDGAGTLLSILFYVTIGFYIFGGIVTYIIGFAAMLWFLRIATVETEQQGHATMDFCNRFIPASILLVFAVSIIQPKGVGVFAILLACFIFLRLTETVKDTIYDEPDRIITNKTSKNASIIAFVWFGFINPDVYLIFCLFGLSALIFFYHPKRDEDEIEDEEETVTS